VIHQGFVPPYRVRFFELLDASSDLEFCVLHGRPPSGTAHRPASKPLRFPNAWTENREVRLAGRTLVYQPVITQLLRHPWSGAVVGAELKLVANFIVLALFKLKRRPVIFWGQGHEKLEDRRGLASVVFSLGNRVKARLARCVDGYLVYTEGGAERLIRSGVDPARVSVVRNTLDMGEQIELHARWLAADPVALRAELGVRPDSVIFLYLGRIYAEKRVEELVEAVRRIRLQAGPGRNVEAIVVGTGPALPGVLRAADGMSDVHLCGEVRDPDAVARVLRIADAVVIPGKVGLAINHAFAHGVPLITRESELHAPEFEYLQQGVNGMVVPGGIDDFTAALRQFASSEGLRRELAEGALATRDELGLDHMVAAFHRGVKRALESAGSRPSRRRSVPRKLRRWRDGGSRGADTAGAAGSLRGD